MTLSGKSNDPTTITGRPVPAAGPDAEPPDAVQAVTARASVRQAAQTRPRGCQFTEVTLGGWDRGEIRTST